MNSVDTSLAMFEIGSIALGYRVLSVICRDTTVKILDASVSGSGRFGILIEGPVANLRTAANEVSRLCETVSRDLLVDQEVIEHPHAALVPALFSLSQVEMGESLVVVEAGSVAALLAASQMLLSWDGVEIIELKAGRGAQGQSLGFFTGKARVVAPAAESVRVKLKTSMREARLEVIDNPPVSFREFFNLSGTA